MILTKEEREKFAEYLRQEAASNRILAAQLAGLRGPATGVLASVKLLLAQAEETVAKELGCWTQENVGG